MKGDAIKSVAANLAGGREPTDPELGLAMAEAVDILLGFFADVTRIANAADKLANPFAGPDGPISF